MSYGFSINDSVSFFNFESKSDLLIDYFEKEYCYDVSTLGLEKTWDLICEFLLSASDDFSGLFPCELIAQMYETGLALVNKEQKKECGQYFTPKDVSSVMAEWFCDVPGYNICDVACGTGQLILSYFELIGKRKARSIISENRLFLYDTDKTALKICVTLILCLYGIDLKEKINVIEGDFLNSDVTLPSNCKVICNPPYSVINDAHDLWNKTEVLMDSKEMYALFMEKIIKQSDGMVIITPYSFIGSAKFLSLRKIMNNYNGFIVSFDNVPGNIFNGRKQGVFNSNKSNSVRAAITVVKNSVDDKGFGLSPLIRFKNEERSKLLDSKVLEGFVFSEKQIITDENNRYYKCDKRLSEIFFAWIDKSSYTLADYLSNNGKYSLFMPNTCRYFTVASENNLKRSGQIELRFSDEDVFNYMFCMINSSFVYWHWRLYDGGITYPKGLLLEMPVFYDCLSYDDKRFFAEMKEELTRKAKDFVVVKNNIGEQHNIKYPRIYRDKINQRLLSVLNIDKNFDVFDCLHSNMVFGE